MAKKLFTQLTEDNPFKKIYSWISPERHWTEKARSWYISYSLFFIVLIAFMALIGEYLFILVILSFVFLWFVQGATPPHDVEHTITSLGIRTFDTFFKWKNIRHFWFSKKAGIVYLQLETFEDAKPDFIKRISLLMKDGDDPKLFNLLVQFIDYGDKKEVGYSIILNLLNGEYFDQNRYLEDDTETFNKLPAPKED